MNVRRKSFAVFRPSAIGVPASTVTVYEVRGLNAPLKEQLQFQLV